MIFDRTFADIEKVKQILKRLKQFTTLTQEEVDTLERGTITYNTLNRIEDKQKELSDILYQWHYLKQPLVTKIWTENGVFNKEDLKRLVENTIVLRESFFLKNSAIPYPNPEYIFTEINAIEETLQSVNDYVELATQSFQFSGAFFSGERSIL